MNMGMNLDLVLLAFIVGLATWGFRFLPTKIRITGANPDGALRRLLAATGPAAIATLFTASIQPMLVSPDAPRWPLAFGIGAVLLLYGWRKSVVVATLGGSLAYGLTVFVTG